MKSSKPFVAAVAVSVMSAGIAAAAHVDFNDPRRALGREGDIRVDAELGQDTLQPNSPLTVTYQIENLTNLTIAVADKVTDTDFDPDSQTITLSIGAEIPSGSHMPHLVTIKAGEKHTFTAGALVHVVVPNTLTPWTTLPRFVQVKVTVLRDVTPFANLIEQQNRTALPVALPKDMFDRWIDASTSVFLNTIPVYWRGESRRGTAESNQPAGTD
ncbi:MAG: hypothetical protein DMF58_08740 [Acidobacteria bacterium]|nr:MAG: hypothetical protein DMF58_08740 [Acidobacteriota bacterium]